MSVVIVPFFIGAILGEILYRIVKRLGYLDAVASKIVSDAFDKVLSERK